jgi:hypothetical protein
MRRSVTVSVLLVLVQVLLPTSVNAASTLWTLVASPITATVGVQKTFALTATNADPLASVLTAKEIRCVFVDVPSNFTLAGAAVTGSTAGDSWRVESIVNNRVTVAANSGGDRLESLDSVSFSVTALPTSSGSLAWPSRAFRDQDCGGSGALVSVPPVVVVTGTSSPPTPRPTPRPTQRPTPTPTPRPLPSVTLPPIPGPSLPGLLATPRPIDSPPPPVPDASTRPTPSASATRVAPSPSSAAIPPGAGASPPLGGDTGGQPAGGVLTPAVFRLPSGDGLDLGLGLGDLNLLSGFETWAVPAATVGGVGLLVLLFIGLQAGGTLIWVPAVRRLRGAKTSRRRRRRHAIG